ncbi:response regulator [Dehalococcoidia bacterium]|nr:response regulator [Dehalococcoidia bacterium]
MAKVLVVDDAQFMRMRATKLLTQNGYEVIEAANGVEAVQKYKEERPDAVMLDITMPDMDGLEALKQLRKIDPGARIAMVTAMGQQSIVLEAIKAGARDFVVKPFDPNRVLTAVQKMIG